MTNHKKRGHYKRVIAMRFGEIHTKELSLRKGVWYEGHLHTDQDPHADITCGTGPSRELLENWLLEQYQKWERTYWKAALRNFAECGRARAP